jgi:acyl carrier protein
MIARSEQLQRIGEELYDIGRVAKAIDEFRLQTQGFKGAAETEPSGTMENKIANIWRKVLGRPGIGLNVNFFEVGGTSLKAVQVITMIRKELNQNLSIVSLFECPTITLLAARLRGSSSSELASSGAVQRGQQRRARARGRTRSR